MTTTSALAAPARRLAREVGRGRRLDDLDARRRRHGEVRREQRHVGAAAARLGGEGDAHAARGAVAEEADGVERLARPAGAHEHALAGERACAGRRRAAPRRGATIASGSLIRPSPVSPSASSPASGPTSSTPRSRSERERSPASPGAPTCAVFIAGATSERPAVRERRLGQDVVGEPVRELGERVRGQRRDHEQVGALEMRVGIGASALAGEREERLGADEALGAGVGSGMTSWPARRAGAQLAGLVGRDATGDPEQDARHGPIVPAVSGTRRYFLYAYLILPWAISSRDMVK